MNKRLEELAIKAKIQMVSEPRLEEFAQLILQDALAICEEKGDQGLDGHYCADEIARLYKD
jgi:hypothetical protein